MPDKPKQTEGAEQIDLDADEQSDLDAVWDERVSKKAQEILKDEATGPTDQK